ncbi:DUF551 domain-containing protein [Klebsiella pneumoniae]
MTSKLTREQLHERARENVKALKMASRQTAFESAREEILADLQLAELALAAMDSEPVALKPELAKVIYHFRDWNEGFPVERFKADYVISWMLANYPPAQPAPLVPDGYVMVPKEMTDEIGEAIAMQANCCGGIALDIYDAMIAAAPHDTPALNSLQSVDSVTGGWIPVSERMPEMGEKQRYVLAADFKNNYWPNIPNTQVGVYGDWFDDGNPTWDDGDGEDLHLKEVTHWMPLPAGPKEVQGE